MEIASQLIQNNLLWFFAGLLGILIILTVWNANLQSLIGKLKKKNEELFLGNNAKNLEELITGQAKSLKTLDKDIQELYNISNQINNLSFKSLHKVGVIRFNPFKDLGGDQSFSIALLNGKNDGFVLSSLHTREGTRIYSKAITSGISEKHPLTGEEEEAIKIALASSKTKKI
jgi:hypothetical protein